VENEGQLVHRQARGVFSQEERKDDALGPSVFCGR
jgi:hypothetical protein